MLSAGERNALDRNNGLLSRGRAPNESPMEGVSAGVSGVTGVVKSLTSLSKSGSLEALEVEAGMVVTTVEELASGGVAPVEEDVEVVDR